MTSHINTYPFAHKAFVNPATATADLARRTLLVLNRTRIARIHAVSEGNHNPVADLAPDDVADVIRCMDPQILVPGGALATEPRATQPFYRTALDATWIGMDRIGLLDVTIDAATDTVRKLGLTQTSIDIMAGGRWADLAAAVAMLDENAHAASLVESHVSRTSMRPTEAEPAPSKLPRISGTMRNFSPFRLFGMADAKY